MNIDIIWFIIGFITGLASAIGGLIFIGRKQIRDAIKQITKEE